MAKTRAQKEASLAKLIDAVKKSKSIIFINFKGLKVKEINKLRRKADDSQMGCLVIKKTLIRKGLETVGLKDAVDINTFENGSALLFGYEDETSPAKLFKEMAKDYKQMEVYGGLLTDPNTENKGLTKDAVIALANLPSKQQLYAQAVGCLNAPLTGFVSVLGGNMRGLLNVLN
ncbi:MAG: 50S ribosomal protein L10, partial [Parcubacteria group bacterium]|nr:50S ribosomal protein L10 [Parcubacteria group bacterium]